MEQKSFQRQLEDVAESEVIDNDDNIRKEEGPKEHKDCDTETKEEVDEHNAQLPLKSTKTVWYRNKRSRWKWCTIATEEHKDCVIQKPKKSSMNTMQNCRLALISFN